MNVKLLLAVTLAITISASSLSADGGRLELFGDAYGNLVNMNLPVGSTANIYLFYLRCDGPTLGNACEFKLSLSTSNAVFLSPIWASDVVVTLGTITEGISIAGSACLGEDIYGNVEDISYLGAIPVLNIGEAGGFVARVEGYPGIMPRVTICEPDHPKREVQGGQFVFNAPLQVIRAEAIAPNRVNVCFGVPVTAETAENAGNYYIFETENPVHVIGITEAELQLDQKTVLLTLAETLSPEAFYSLRASNVQDFSGRTVLYWHTVPIIIGDWVPPDFISARAIGSASLELAFSERLDPATATSAVNYVVREALDPSMIIPVSVAGLHPDGMRVRLSLADSLIVGVSYAVHVDNVKDLAGNTVVQPNEITFLMPDIYPPVVVGISVLDSSLLEAAFNEPLDPGSAACEINYSLAPTSNPAATLAIINAMLMADQSVVRLLLGTPLTYNISFTLRISNVADTAQNVIAPGSSVNFIYYDTIPPTLAGIDAPADSIVRVSFSEQIDHSSAEDEGNYILYESLQPVNLVPVSRADVIGSGDMVQLSLDAHMIHGTSYTLRVSNVLDGGMIRIEPNSEISFTYIDSAPPILLSVRSLGASSIELGFSEAIAAITAEDPANYAVNSEGELINALYAELIDEQTVVLALAGSLDPMVQYTVTAANIRDLAGNIITQGTITRTLIPLEITHAPIQCCRPGMDLYVPWQASDVLHGIASSCLFYRALGSTEWVDLCENNPINPIVMAIPGSSIAEDGMEYYITATNGIGVAANSGSREAPHFIPLCPPVTCVQPILSLAGYTSVSYVPPIWMVRVQVLNGGPGIAKSIAVTMNSDISWLVIPDPLCTYGDIPAYGSSFGETDGFSFDLTNHPGGSFNVWFDVSYADSCGNAYRVRLDPEFSIDDIQNVGLAAPTAFCLRQNYPNPFNPATAISYELAAPSHVILRIFDVSGRLVRTIVNENKDSGVYSSIWDGTDNAGKSMSSGIYFCRLQAGDYMETKRMVLLR